MVEPRIKRFCANLIFTIAIQYLADREGITVDMARKKMIHSKIYDALFDYETGFWGEGPIYLLFWYDLYRFEGDWQKTNELWKDYEEERRKKLFKD